MNSQNLTIYDFVVDIVPGALAILLFLSLLPVDVVAGLDIGDITVGSSILVIVLGYFIGHLIQAVASPIDNWVYFLRRDEYPFEKTLQEASSDSVEERFSDNVDAFFELETKEPDNLTGIERYSNSPRAISGITTSAGHNGFRFCTPFFGVCGFFRYWVRSCIFLA